MTIKKSYNNLHILHLSSWFPSIEKPFFGNFIEIFVLELSKSSEITIGLKSNQLFSNKSVQNTDIKQVKLTNSKRSIFINTLVYLKNIILLAQQPQFDIVHFHVSQNLFFEILMVRLFTNKKTVLTEHGSYLIKKKQSWVEKMKIQMTHKLVHKVVFVSRFLRENSFVHIPHKSKVIGNVLPQFWFEHSKAFSDQKKNKYNFLHVSTLDDVKNISGILDALHLLKKEMNSTFHFHFVSDESTKELKEKILALDLMDCVTVFGRYEPIDLVLIYDQCDCLVINSSVETFSIVSAEALARGLHVISTPVGFLAHQDSPVVSILKFDDAAFLCATMKRAIIDKKRSGKLGQKIARDFSAESVTNTYMQLYVQLIYGE